MPWFGIGLGCSLGGIIGAFLFCNLDKISRTIRSSAIIILISIALFGAVVGVFAPREMTPRYQVIIDDGVEFNEFISKYKIIEQEGLIYTVEERECNTG